MARGRSSLADRFARGRRARSGLLTELERQLGVSRTALNLAVRALLAEKRIERIGRGATTRYAVRPSAS